MSLVVTAGCRTWVGVKRCISGAPGASRLVGAHLGGACGMPGSVLCRFWAVVRVAEGGKAGVTAVVDEHVVDDMAVRVDACGVMAGS